jgi:hypothetical protein
MMGRLCVIVLCSALLLSAAGCGASGARDQARDAAQQLYAAVRAHDGEKACAQMSPALRAALVDDEQERCAKAVMALDLSGRRVAAVDVYSNNARVRFAGGDTVFLGESQGGWRVEALGCKPQGAGPYDCEAEA